MLIELQLRYLHDWFSSFLHSQVLSYSLLLRYIYAHFFSLHLSIFAQLQHSSWTSTTVSTCLLPALYCTQMLWNVTNYLLISFTTSTTIANKFCKFSTCNLNFNYCISMIDLAQYNIPLPWHTTYHFVISMYIFSHFRNKFSETSTCYLNFNYCFFMIDLAHSYTLKSCHTAYYLDISMHIFSHCSYNFLHNFNIRVELQLLCRLVCCQHSAAHKFFGIKITTYS